MIYSHFRIVDPRFQGFFSTVGDGSIAIQVESATIFGEANFGACCIDDLGAGSPGRPSFQHALTDLLEISRDLYLYFEW